MGEQEDRAFIRWQSTTITQLGHANNVLVGLAAGGLAFSAHVLIDGALVSRTAVCLLVVAAGLLLTSSFGGLACLLTRLYDFRTSAHIARAKEKNSGANEVDDLRLQARSLGKWTWSLFWLQVLGFGLGALFLVVALGIHVLCGRGAAA